jgi:hypothetical protein
MDSPVTWQAAHIMLILTLAAAFAFLMIVL